MSYKTISSALTVSAGGAARNLSFAALHRGVVVIAAGAALLAAPARADIVLPVAMGGGTFHGFSDDTGASIDTECGDSFFPLGTAPCAGPVTYSGGPLGDGIHTTGDATGTATISGASGSTGPMATAHLDSSGGDTIDGNKITGQGAHSVTAKLSYYVTVVPLSATPVPAPDIPLTFTDSGSLSGESSAGLSVDGTAHTAIFAFAGHLLMGGLNSSVFDQIDDNAEGGSISKSYSNSYTLFFDLSEGDTIAEVDLSTECELQAQSAGFTSGSCTASADPFIGFDQTAFNTMMGANSFTLGDFFEILVSPGLEASAATGIPEPESLTLFATAAGYAVARVRRRAKQGFSI
jgi:hypothetical protein